MSDLEIREFEIRSVEEDGTFEALAVRWGEVANIGGKYKEAFERGAFDGSDDIKVYRDHKEIIGHVIEKEDREDGFWFKAKVALTSLGNDTLALLRSGALTKVSVGFVPQEQRNDNGVITRTKALLREISVVERPAYAGASVLSVREEDPTEPRSLTTKEESAMTDSVEVGLTEVRSEIEELRQELTMLPDKLSAPVESVDQRSAAAVVLAIANGDEETIQRYNAIQEHRYDELQHRAYTGGTTADSPIQDAWVGDLTRIFDASSGVLSAVFSTGTLPQKGMNIEFAELASNSMTVTEQEDEGDDLDFGKVTLTTRTAPVKTYGGRTQLSFQEIDRSTLPILARNLEALSVAAGARKKAVLRAAYATLVGQREAIAANGGVIVLGATLGNSKESQWTDAVIDAAIRFDQQNLGIDALLVSPHVFKHLKNATDVQVVSVEEGEQAVAGSRVFSISGPIPQVGTLNLPGLTGSLAGLTVIADPGFSSAQAAFVNHRAIRQYDSALVSLQDTNVINLSKDFSVYRYGAVAAEIPVGVLPVKLAAS